MFSRASQHEILIQDLSILQGTLSHFVPCFASKHSILRLVINWCLKNYWYLKNLLPGPPMFFPTWKVKWGIRNILTPTKPENPNSWGPNSWCYIIRINPNIYISLIPFTHTAENWGELGQKDSRACVLHQGRHVFSVVVAIALITHTRQIFSASFYFHFLGGARAAHQPATAPAVMAPVKLSNSLEVMDEPLREFTEVPSCVSLHSWVNLFHLKGGNTMQHKAFQNYTVIDSLC